MAAGKWPSSNADGVPYPAHSINGKLAGRELAGGWAGIVCAATGDLEFHHHGYELQNPNSGSDKPLKIKGGRAPPEKNKTTPNSYMHVRNQEVVLT